MRSRNRRAAALVATLALHLLLILLFATSGEPPRSSTGADTVPFVIAPSPAPQPLANYASMEPEERAERPPDEANFISQFNQRADRETTARKSQGAGESSTPTREREQGQPGESQSAAPLATATPEPGRPLFVSPGGGKNGEAEAGEGVGPGSLALRDFKPRYDALQPSAARSGSAMERDYLPLPESDRSRINALQSTYWSFFDRAKSRLQRNWNPARVFRRFDPDFRKLGSERTTVVKITLQQDGAILEAAVSRSSGLDFLDQEALRALRAAKPFNNVPPGMLDQFGRATFEWAFVVTPEGSSTRWLGR
jgi:TonB family protein